MATDAHNVNEISRISAHSFQKGNFYSDNDIRIDGVFEGDIVTNGKAVVGENAKVSGNIICANLDVWGNITGEVFVKDVLCLKASANVQGNMHYSRIQLEFGASFEGMCKRMAAEEFDGIFAAKDIRKKTEE